MLTLLKLQLIKELETYEEELEIGTHYNYFNCK